MQTPVLFLAILALYGVFVVKEKDNLKSSHISHISSEENVFKVLEEHLKVAQRRLQPWLSADEYRIQQRQKRQSALWLDDFQRSLNARNLTIRWLVNGPQEHLPISQFLAKTLVINLKQASGLRQQASENLAEDLLFAFKEWAISFAWHKDSNDRREKISTEYLSILNSLAASISIAARTEKKQLQDTISMILKGAQQEQKIFRKNSVPTNDTEKSQILARWHLAWMKLFFIFDLNGSQEILTVNSGCADQVLSYVAENTFSSSSANVLEAITTATKYIAYSSSDGITNSNILETIFASISMNAPAHNPGDYVPEFFQTLHRKGVGALVNVLRKYPSWPLDEFGKSPCRASYHNMPLRMSLLQQAVESSKLLKMAVTNGELYTIGTLGRALCAVAEWMVPSIVDENADIRKDSDTLMEAMILIAELPYDDDAATMGLHFWHLLSLRLNMANSKSAVKASSIYERYFRAICSMSILPPPPLSHDELIDFSRNDPNYGMLAFNPALENNADDSRERSSFRDALRDAIVDAKTVLGERRLWEIIVEETVANLGQIEQKKRGHRAISSLKQVLRDVDLKDYSGWSAIESYLFMISYAIEGIPDEMERTNGTSSGYGSTILYQYLEEPFEVIEYISKRAQELKGDIPWQLVESVGRFTRNSARMLRKFGNISDLHTLSLSLLQRHTIVVGEMMGCNWIRWNDQAIRALSDATLAISRTALAIQNLSRRLKLEMTEDFITLNLLVVQLWNSGPGNQLRMLGDAGSQLSFNEAAIISTSCLPETSQRQNSYAYMLSQCNRHFEALNIDLKNNSRKTPQIMGSIRCFSNLLSPRTVATINGHTTEVITKEEDRTFLQIAFNAFSENISESWGGQYFTYASRWDESLEFEWNRMVKEGIDVVKKLSEIVSGNKKIGLEKFVREIISMVAKGIRYNHVSSYAMDTLRHIIKTFKPYEDWHESMQFNQFYHPLILRSMHEHKTTRVGFPNAESLPPNRRLADDMMTQVLNTSEIVTPFYLHIDPEYAREGFIRQYNDAHREIVEEFLELISTFVDHFPLCALRTRLIENILSGGAFPLDTYDDPKLNMLVLSVWKKCISLGLPQYLRSTILRSPSYVSLFKPSSEDEEIQSEYFSYHAPPRVILLRELERQKMETNYELSLDAYINDRRNFSALSMGRREDLVIHSFADMVVSTLASQDRHGTELGYVVVSSTITSILQSLYKETANEGVGILRILHELSLEHTAVKFYDWFSKAVDYISSSLPPTAIEGIKTNFQDIDFSNESSLLSNLLFLKSVVTSHLGTRHTQFHE